MSFVVTGRCVSCVYTWCAEECPTEAVVEITHPTMSVIHPEWCTSCAACAVACPVNAIYEEADLPEIYAGWAAYNAARAPEGASRARRDEPAPTARTLAEIQAEEARRGWSIPEPIDYS